MPTGVYQRTKEYSKAMSKAMKGIPSWNEGLTKNIDDRVKKYSETISKLQKGKGNNNWGGGRWKVPSGYILIWDPEHPNANNDRCVREHILVMEKKLGRYLKEKEIVHHINGIKDDNRIKNLYLFSNSGSHTIYERNVRETYLRWIRAEIDLGLDIIKGRQKEKIKTKE